MKTPILLLLLCPAAQAAEARKAPAPVWTISGLAQPESAWSDGTALYISNVAGEPGGKDAQGWITKSALDGTVLEPKWVSGLDAPKGLRGCGGKLYAADIDAIAVIELANGTLERVELPAARMANDVAVAPDCSVYVSDTLASRIYKIGPGRKVEIAGEGAAFDSPNGLAFHEDSLFVASWGLAAPDWSTRTPGRLHRFSHGKLKVLPGPRGNLDGLERAAGGWLVSDWVAGKVYFVDAKGKTRLLLEGLGGAADLFYLAPQDLLIVPRMKDGLVDAYRLAQLLR